MFSKTLASQYLNDVAQITDFKDGFDMIGLQGLTYSELCIEQGTGSREANTIISLVTGDALVVLVGVNSYMITSSDFTSVIYITV